MRIPFATSFIATAHAREPARRPLAAMAMSDSERPEHAGEAAGILYGGLAYAVWGIIPAYWRLLGDVPPFEITMHRILWCSIFVVGA